MASLFCTFVLSTNMENITRYTCNFYLNEYIMSKWIYVLRCVSPFVEQKWKKYTKITKCITLELWLLILSSGIRVPAFEFWLSLLQVVYLWSLRRVLETFWRLAGRPKVPALSGQRAKMPKWFERVSDN